MTHHVLDERAMNLFFSGDDGIQFPHLTQSKKKGEDSTWTSKLLSRIREEDHWKSKKIGL